MARDQARLAGGAAVVGVLLAVGIWAIWGGNEKPTLAESAAETAATETAAVEPAPVAPLAVVPALGDAVVADPKTAPDPAAQLDAAAPQPPRLDVVRVDAAGLTAVAGRAAPGAEVILRLDGVDVARGLAGASGQFALLVTLPPSSVPRLLGLGSVLDGGAEVPGAETVAIAPFALAQPEAVLADVAPVEATADPGETVLAADAPDPGAPDPGAPAALLLAPEGVTVLQSGTGLQIRGALSIDSITYGTMGQVVLGGRATPNGALRIYLDAAPLAETRADETGRWQVALDGVAGGLHALRADEIDSAGKVLARVETPFQRDLPVVAASLAAPVAPDTTAQDPAPTVAAAPITITVQPGLTLWAIARENFGEGVMYVQVFEANRDKIKDPDLIYPGQIFTVPKP